MPMRSHRSPVELQRLIGTGNVASSASPRARTAGALLRAAEDAREDRRRAKEARAEAEKKRRERKAASERSEYLDDLATREPAVWSEIARLIATKSPLSYDRAVVLLIDLRDVAAVHHRESSFLSRLEALRTEHARKPSLIAKLDHAGLT